MRFLPGCVVIAAALALGPAQLGAQVRSVDPNSAIDADLSPARPAGQQREQLVDAGPQDVTPAAGVAPAVPAAPAPVPASSNGSGLARTTAAAEASTYKREDLIAAGEGVFGKGAEGLAGMLEKLLREQGEPHAYIAGREASGAFVVGLRYGSGLMSHKIEGQRPVYWTGPSVGFDVGGDANKVFALVYNLYDTQDIFTRFPAAEGRLYLVGGFSATYLRHGKTVIIPIRLGVGWRAGANLGYMKITEKAKWLPF